MGQRLEQQLDQRMLSLFAVVQGTMQVIQSDMQQGLARVQELAAAGSENEAGERHLEDAVTTCETDSCEARETTEYNSSSDQSQLSETESLQLLEMVNQHVDRRLQECANAIQSVIQETMCTTLAPLVLQLSEINKVEQHIIKKK